MFRVVTVGGGFDAFPRSDASTPPPDQGSLAPVGGEPVRQGTFSSGADTGTGPLTRAAASL
jgi:hypothetical protein